MTPWTVALQTPLSMGLSRLEYWSGLPFPSPRDFPNPGIEPWSPALQADSSLSESAVIQSINHVQLFCNPMNCSKPDFSLLHYLPEFAENHFPLSWWCHLTISSSVAPFSSCLQSFPESGSFPMSRLFTSGNQSIGASTSVTVLPMNTQDWFPLGWTGWISL